MRASLVIRRGGISTAPPAVMQRSILTISWPSPPTFLREVEKAIQSATKSSLPAWYYNRRNDPDTGETKQLLGSDLDFVIKGDIDDEKNIQSWKGVRHSLGLKVRGQRTRTTGRKGRTVGVRKAALIAAAKEAGEKKEEK